jgi:archaellum component FlaC
MAEAINRKLHSIAESNQMTDRQLDQQGRKVQDVLDHLGGQDKKMDQQGRKVQDVLDHLGGQDKKMLKTDGDIAWLAASYRAVGEEVSKLQGTVQETATSLGHIHTAVESLLEHVKALKTVPQQVPVMLPS